MEMNIEVGPGGKIFLVDAPQQKWQGENPEIMQVSNFAGQEMMAIQKSDYEPEIYELHYLGFRTSGFVGMAKAKESAPGFARKVLSKMAEMIAD